MISLFPYDVAAYLEKKQRCAYRLDAILSPWAPGGVPQGETPWSMRYIVPPDREIW